MLPLILSRRYPLVPRLNTAPGLQSLLGSQEGLGCDLPRVAIEVITAYGDTKTLRFFYDTGADHMVMPVYAARHYGIRYREAFPGTVSSSVGGSVRCYYDFVQVRSSLSGRTHRWVCAFADSLSAPLIVGRSGFHDDFAAAIRGGHLVVSHPVSLARFLRHHATKVRTRARSRDEWEPI
jgi:hypothetical protein